MLTAPPLQNTHMNNPIRLLLKAKLENKRYQHILQEHFEIQWHEILRTKFSTTKILLLPVGTIFLKEDLGDLGISKEIFSL